MRYEVLYCTVRSPVPAILYRTTVRSTVSYCKYSTSCSPTGPEGVTTYEVHNAQGSTVRWFRSTVLVLSYSRTHRLKLALPYSVLAPKCRTTRYTLPLQRPGQERGCQPQRPSALPSVAGTQDPPCQQKFNPSKSRFDLRTNLSLSSLCEYPDYPDSLCQFCLSLTPHLATVHLFHI